jgi:peptidoglycan/LPS O-acetylase OafA/YrhL
MNKRPPLHALTGVRFFAALAVFLFHYSAGFNGYLKAIVEYGYLGVSFFFVLSGFILAYNYAEKEFDIRRFAIARFARIYPVYAFAIMFGVLLIWLAPQTSHQPPMSVPLALQVVIESFLLQAWTPWTYCGINCSGWSLSAEAFFYLCFPFIIVVMQKWSNVWLRIMMPVFWLFAMLVPTIAIGANPTLGVMRSADHNLILDTVIYNPLLNLPQFLLGACVGLLYLRRIQTVAYPTYGSRVVLIIAIVSLVSLICVMALKPRGIPEIFVRTGLFAPIFASFMYALARDPDNLVSRFLSAKPIVILGEASYALYILQIGVYQVLEAVGFTQLIVNRGALIVGGAISIITIATALLAFYFIETPARKAITQWLSRPIVRSNEQTVKVRK